MTDFREALRLAIARQKRTEVSGMEKHPAYFTFDEEAERRGVGRFYYFAPLNAQRPPYLHQREVKAIIDIADDGTLAGVELIDDMPPPPRAPVESCIEITDFEITSIDGNCPVQAEGVVDGEPFYFRARGDSWSMNIGGDVITAPDWSYEEPYGTWPEAGWMTVDEAIAFISKAVGLWRQRNAGK